MLYACLLPISLPLPLYCLLSHGLSIPRQSVLSHKGMQAGNRSVSRPAEGGRQAGRQAVSQFAGQLVSQSVGRTVIHNESKQHAYNYVACLHPFLSVGQSVRSWLGLFVLLIQLCWLINKNRIDRNFRASWNNLLRCLKLGNSCVNAWRCQWLCRYLCLSPCLSTCQSNLHGSITFSVCASNSHYQGRPGSANQKSLTEDTVKKQLA